MGFSFGLSELQLDELVRFWAPCTYAGYDADLCLETRRLVTKRLQRQEISAVASLSVQVFLLTISSQVTNEHNCWKGISAVIRYISLG